MSINIDEIMRLENTNSLKIAYLRDLKKTQNAEILRIGGAGGNPIASKASNVGKKTSKCRNVKIFDEKYGWFDSKWEYRRWGQLLIMQGADEITNLTRQISYPLIVNGERIGRYTVDFQYLQNGRLVVEDAKGVERPAWRRTAKIFIVCYPDIPLFVTFADSAKNYYFKDVTK